MSEWRLWAGDVPPYFTTVDFFRGHPHIPPYHQLGFNDRIKMVYDSAVRLIDDPNIGTQIRSVVDLGCGDGTLMSMLEKYFAGHVGFHGITAGGADVLVANAAGLAVDTGNFLLDEPRWEEYDVTIMTEVLEHLADPHGWLKRVGTEYLIASSPSAENDHWHYEHHAWAWDLNGYEDMMEKAGWRVLWQDECQTDAVERDGLMLPQRFQVVVCQREEFPWRSRRAG